MCRFHQTSPESPFTRKKVCSKATPRGRITVSDRRLIISRNGQKTERLLNSEGEWHSVLEAYFGVIL